MELIIAVLSIFLITGIIRLFNGFSSFKICPICAGVSGTWLWMLIGTILGGLQATDYKLLIAILMGGSVVGIAYQAEKRLLRSDRNALVWKAIFMPFGFVTVFLVINFFWLEALIGILALIAISLLFLDDKIDANTRMNTNNTNNIDTNSVVSKSRRKKLEKEMEECC